MSSDQPLNESFNLEVVESNKRRQQNDLITLTQNWAANDTTQGRIVLVSRIPGFKAEWKNNGGAKDEQYTSPSRSVTLTYAGGGKPSSFAVELDMNGTYTINKAGEIDDVLLTTRVGNKVLNTLNMWLSEVGAHYNFDVIGMLQRANSTQESEVDHRTRSPK